MDSFLRYAMDNQKKLRAVWMDGGSLMQKTVAVERFDAAEVAFLYAGRKAPVIVKREDLLSLGYARGDNGEG